MPRPSASPALRVLRTLRTGSRMTLRRHKDFLALAALCRKSPATADYSPSGHSALPWLAAEDIKSRINWDTIKLYKMNTEFIEESAAEDKQRDRHADIVYNVKYDDQQRDCFLCLHAEHQSTAQKLMPLRFLNYNSSLLLEQAEINPNKPLPVIISICYYHGKPSPYPYSLDIYDLFDDKDLAKQHLLQPLLVDLKQLPESELAKHGAIFPMEALYKLAFEEGLNNDDYDLFLKAIVQQKDNEYVVQYLKVLLKYAANALDCNYDNFAKRFIETLPELEDTMSTMAQQLEERGVEKGLKQGVQQGMHSMACNVAKSMIKKEMPVSEISEITGLTVVEISSLVRQIDSEQEQY